MQNSSKFFSKKNQNLSSFYITNKEEHYKFML